MQKIRSHEVVVNVTYNGTGDIVDTRQYIVTTHILVFSILLSACGAKPFLESTVTPTATLALTATSTSAPTLTPTPTSSPTVTPTPLGGGLGKIAFVSKRDGNEEIYVMNSDGTGLTRVTNNYDSNTDPNWSPDGTKIIYRSERIDRGRWTGIVDVYVMNADGSGSTNLTENSSSFGVEEPKWSPDGKKIAYIECVPDKLLESCGEIFVMNADGSEKKQITNNGYDDRYFAWSPDSKQIAFWSYRNKQGDIYVINIDGSGELKLTNNPKYPHSISYNIDPSWSPDGKTILYMSTNFNTPHYEIYAIHPDGNAETRITKTKSSEWLESGSQMWSPDGKKIAFMYWDKQGDQIKDRICIMNSDGSERIYITDGPFDDYPRWSPDGKKIAFVSARDGQPELYIVNPDGSDQTRITYSSVHEDWLWQFQWAP